MNKDIQYNTISAGFALGLAMLDKSELKDSGINFNLKFWSAWDAWEPSKYFPGVSKRALEYDGKGLKPSVFIKQYTEQKRQPVSSLFWNGSTVYCYGESWSKTEAAEDAHLIHENIDAHDWAELVANCI